MTGLWAALSGALFALIPVGVRAAAGQGIEPRLLLVVAMPLCALVMLPGAIADPGPATAWLAGATCGIEQFGALLLLRWGLRHGPMAPLWSAQMLNFVLVILWCWWWLGETPTAGHGVAMVAALASVAMAAIAAGDGGRTGSWLPYAIALVSLWVLNGATNATFKWLASVPAPTGGDLMSAHGDAAMVAMYATIALGAGMDLLLRPCRAPAAALALHAVVVACGSLGGLLLLRLALVGPAARVFTLNTAASLLAAAVFAWLFWRDRPSRAGWASLALALAAVAAGAPV